MANKEIQTVREVWLSRPFGETLPQWRVAYDTMSELFPSAPDIEVTKATVNGVPAEWYSAPGIDANRVTLFLHGGGYGLGSLTSHRHFATEVGRSAGTKVLAIDYRLAPEAPFPAAVDDALAAYRYLLDAGFDPLSISVMGDSAGGGLAVALLLAVRDAGLPQPSCAVCISPWADMALEGSTMTTKAAEDQMAPKPMLMLLRDSYVGDAGERHPLVSPIYADLKGIAPLLILVGSAETLLDDALRLAGAAGAAEVPVRLEIWPEMVHVWPLFYQILAEGRQALVRMGEYIREKSA